MGDLECGFEEMQGVKLGYLLIKGKQMFALSQVFTDLLKNIPRTTVHKRMDHLNVKKHHCDLEELRRLKAIHSIAFHAAKCTLISREDVEALYFSCKTERVLKSNKRKVKPAPPGQDARQGPRSPDAHHDAGLWRQEKVWLSLHSVPQSLSLQNKPARRRELVPPGPPDSSKLPQFYSKSRGRDGNPAPRSKCKPFKNYETPQTTGNRLTLSQRHSFLRSAAPHHRQPVLHSAIAAQSIGASSGDLLHRRKRRRDGGGGGRSGRHSSHHPPVLVVHPKCCGKAKSPGNGTLGTFHLAHDFYLQDPRPNHHHHRPTAFLESYSSDTESSTYSDRANNDSDFGSSFSTSSNSGSSDEEEEEDEDDSPSESSEVSSEEEESSSHSDSSSVSSRVSVQSIRFRRARVATNLTKSVNTKAPLVLQPTFHYSHQQHRTQATLGLLDPSRQEKGPKCDFSSDIRKETGPVQPPKFSLIDVRGSFFSESKKGEHFSEGHSDPKRVKPVDVAHHYTTQRTNWNQTFPPPRRTPGHPSKCPPALSSHCGHDRDTKPCKSTDIKQQLALAAHLKSDVKTIIHHHLKSKSPSPLKTIKTEAEEPAVTAHRDSDRATAAGKTSPFNFQNVKIKVEDTSHDDYEYPYQTSAFQCKAAAEKNNGPALLYPGGDIKQAFNNNTTTTKAIEDSAAVPCGPPGPPSPSQECRTTQDAPWPEQGDYKNGARVRKNYRTLVLGKKNGGIARKHNASNNKVDHNKGSFSRSEGSSDQDLLSGTSKRKRAVGIGVAAAAASPAKKAFSFMANFPSPPSLVVGSDGDLCPAYSLNSLRDPRPPPLSHPVWQWQPGGQPLPLPPPHAQRTRK